MATNALWSVAGKNLALDALLNPLDGGFMDIYAGDGAGQVAPGNELAGRRNGLRLHLLVVYDEAENPVDRQGQCVEGHVDQPSMLPGTFLPM